MCMSVRGAVPVRRAFEVPIACPAGPFEEKIDAYQGDPLQL